MASFCLLAHEGGAHAAPDHNGRAPRGRSSTARHGSGCGGRRDCAMATAASAAVPAGGSPFTTLSRDRTRSPICLRSVIVAMRENTLAHSPCKEASFLEGERATPSAEGAASFVQKRGLRPDSG